MLMKKYFRFEISNVILTSGFVLLFVWGLPHTIALRNLLLFIGGGFSSYYLLKNRAIFSTNFAIPLKIFLLIFPWVIFHYVSFSIANEIELNDLKTLWLRCFLGVLMGISINLVIRTRPEFQKYFPIAFFGMSFSVVSVYVYQSSLHHQFLSPAIFLGSYLFDGNKVGTAFFSVIDVAVGCGYLIYLKKNSNKTFKERLNSVIAFFILIGISLSSSLIANSKNGVAIGLITFTFFLTLIGIILVKGYKKYTKDSINLTIMISVITIILMLGIGVLHKRNASPGWANLLEDIKIAIDIDHHDKWKDTLGPQPWPLNATGTQVAGNTYERFSWASAGLRLVHAHPLGYGTINGKFSFIGWLNYDKVEHHLVNATHSGWIDLALSFGIPAICMTLGVLISVLIIGIFQKNKQAHSYVSIMMSFALIIAPIVQEVTYKHTFEALLFFIAFAATGVIPNDHLREEFIKN